MRASTANITVQVFKMELQFLLHIINKSYLSVCSTDTK